jgi:signal transduction histidine kinase
MAGTEVSGPLRFSETKLLKEIRRETGSRLWYLDRQLWSRTGAITRCLQSLVRELCAVLAQSEPPLPSDGRSPPLLAACVPDLSGAGIAWADVSALLDIVQEQAISSLKSESAETATWVIRAAVGSLKADVAGSYLRVQAEEMARNRDDGVAAQHLAGRFLANASHELRTPLTAVLGFSELLLEGTYGPLNDEQRLAVGHIENSAQNLLEIVNNLLDLMQFRAGRLQLQYRHIAPAPILRNIYDILLPLSKRRKVRFRHEIPENLGTMDADEGILRHIVYHLLESALRATPENGEVVLRAERGDSDLTILTYDTALHFPQEAIQNMNDAYPILENSPARGYEGWEIGLPLVRRYVELHSGSLDIVSNPADGTTIAVHLPTRRVQKPDGARRGATDRRD